LGRPLTEDELCSKLLEWGKDSQEYEIGFIPFAIIKADCFQQASQQEPVLFDDLWVYNNSNADVMTADGR